MAVKESCTLSFLRKAALIVLICGAVGSLYFVLHAGSKNKSFLLSTLFVIWVLSPFTAFLTANTISKRWSFFARKAFYWLILVITPGSLISYSCASYVLLTKPAFIFLVVPLISWLLMMIIFATVRILS